ASIIAGFPPFRRRLLKIFKSPSLNRCPMAGRYSARICFLVAVTTAAVGADPSWSLRAWQTEDGLPNNIVTSVAQTPDGYLWLATPTALARFDGTRFESVPRETLGPGSGPSRHVLTLLYGDEGMWFGFDHGPLMYAKN